MNHCVLAQAITDPKNSKQKKQTLYEHTSNIIINLYGQASSIIYFFRSAEDLLKLRKQAQMMKKTYEEKLIEMETSVTKSNDQNNILQNQIKEHQLEVNKLKDVIKVFSKPNVGSSEHF